MKIVTLRIIQWLILLCGIGMLGLGLLLIDNPIPNQEWEPATVVYTADGAPFGMSKEHGITRFTKGRPAAATVKLEQGETVTAEYFGNCHEGQEVLAKVRRGRFTGHMYGVIDVLCHKYPDFTDDPR